ncbi:hypothetical protein [Streptomyces sp. NPDC001165]|uniref:hypothetical protein n=1 Tax=Streptomyces sp. NPDC001165 TaxID=3364546 RepID=UPI003673B0DF
MTADRVSADDAPAEPLTVFQALQFDDPLYRRFTAFHEAGHAIVALATGEASVAECVLSPTQTPAGGTAEAYTDASWNSAAAYLTLLYGGVLVQQRWLHEQQLWSPLRESAVQTLASHDYAALMKTGATAAELSRAHETAVVLRDRHWPAIIATAALLDQNGRVTGDELDAMLHQHPAGPDSPVLTIDQATRARAIAAESRHRAAHRPGPPPQPQPRVPGPSDGQAHIHPPLRRGTGTSAGDHP